MAVEREQSGGVEPSDDRTQTNHWEQPQELRLSVELGNRPGDRNATKPQRKAANDLQGPSCVEKSWVISALVLDNARTNADIGEQVQSNYEDIKQSHESEQFWEEQASQNQVTAESQDLARPITSDSPDHTPDS